eukprot:scaffold401_cov399-Prasinococcus_capsulatus_cf.AAC.37
MKDAFRSSQKIRRSRLTGLHGSPSDTAFSMRGRPTLLLPKSKDEEAQRNGGTTCLAWGRASLGKQ